MILESLSTVESSSSAGLGPLQSTTDLELLCIWMRRAAKEDKPGDVFDG